LLLLGVPPLGGYKYITPRRAGLSATAGLSCLIQAASSINNRQKQWHKSTHKHKKHRKTDRKETVQ